MKPVVITVGGSSLENWTEMTLSRKKEDLTGQLSVTIFAGAVPALPMARAARAGAEIQVYIAGQLAFTGTVDERRGTGAKKGKHHGTKQSGKDQQGGSYSISIGPNDYSIKLSARGKTKRLIDSAHQHPTTNMLQPTTKEVVEKLIEPWKTQLEWKGETVKLDKARFRDGARVVDELHRVAMENAYFMYETRDGKLRVTDGVGSSGGSGGDALILGENILEFSASQSEDEAKSKIKVKGQRSKKDKWGEESLMKTFKTVEDKWVKDFVPETVQHYGDADDKTLERRARFEANKRSSTSKKIEITVFHVQTPSGQPWDIGDTHYVEVPPEGIFDVFEVIELEYHVTHDKTIRTKLTLSPPPSGGAGGGGGGSGGYGLSSINTSMGNARASQVGFTMSAGSYPAPWSSPMLSELPFITLAEEAAKASTQDTTMQQKQQTPPLVLPEWFEG